MKPLIPGILIFIVCGIAARITVRPSAVPLFKTIIVHRFANSSGTAQSPEYIQSFCDGMRDELEKLNLAGQVVEEGVTVNAADASDSLVIEGKFTGYASGGVLFPQTMGIEIDIYRASDDALVKSFTTTIAHRPTPLTSDKSQGAWAGGLGSRFIEQRLKGVSLQAGGSAN